MGALLWARVLPWPQASLSGTGVMLDQPCPGQRGGFRASPLPEGFGVQLREGWQGWGMSVFWGSLGSHFSSHGGPWGRTRSILPVPSSSSSAAHIDLLLGMPWGIIQPYGAPPNPRGIILTL